MLPVVLMMTNPEPNQVRFKFLFSKISFNDFETRAERWKKDIFSAIRNIFEKFNNNCGKSVIPAIFFQLTKLYIP